MRCGSDPLSRRVSIPRGTLAASGRTHQQSPTRTRGDRPQGASAAHGSDLGPVGRWAQSSQNRVHRPGWASGRRLLLQLEHEAALMSALQESAETLTCGFVAQRLQTTMEVWFRCNLLVSPGPDGSLSLRCGAGGWCRSGPSRNQVKGRAVLINTKMLQLHRRPRGTDLWPPWFWFWFSLNWNR